jgi:hypothetical protein
MKKNKIPHPTPPNIQINSSLLWNKILFPPPPLQNIDPPLMPNYSINSHCKSSPKFSYYIDGSFIPPKEEANGLWTRETSSYKIYNPEKTFQSQKDFQQRSFNNKESPNGKKIFTNAHLIHEDIELSFTFFLEMTI